jgi:hypothetical protein
VRVRLIRRHTANKLKKPTIHRLQTLTKVTHFHLQALQGILLQLFQFIVRSHYFFFLKLVRMEGTAPSSG